MCIRPKTLPHPPKAIAWYSRRPQSRRSSIAWSIKTSIDLEHSNRHYCTTTESSNIGFENCEGQSRSGATAMPIIDGRRLLPTLPTTINTMDSLLGIGPIVRRRLSATTTYGQRIMCAHCTARNNVGRQTYLTQKLTPPSSSAISRYSSADRRLTGQGTRQVGPGATIRVFRSFPDSLHGIICLNLPRSSSGMKTKVRARIDGASDDTDVPVCRTFLAYLRCLFQ